MEQPQPFRLLKTNKVWGRYLYGLKVRGLMLFFQTFCDLHKSSSSCFSLFSFCLWNSQRYCSPEFGTHITLKIPLKKPRNEQDMHKYLIISVCFTMDNSTLFVQINPMLKYQGNLWKSQFKCEISISRESWNRKLQSLQLANSCCYFPFDLFGYFSNVANHMQAKNKHLKITSQPHLGYQ